ncbi:MAG: prepilin-type N-terminal cleavage/methylation domain-containing protein [Phycisphaeraceae bacterium]|nr:prepilin-type N-terminal cleavage/methylation domain-containing protein [Phycisphaeraceae bacterium]
MRDARGFTLLEVMVALGLLGLVATFTLPVVLTNGPRARAQTAERMLVLSPNMARGEARALGQPVALVLLPEPASPGTQGASLRLVVVRRPDPDSNRAADQRADPGDLATWPIVGQDARLPEGTSIWNGSQSDLDLFEPEGEGDVFEIALARLPEANGANRPMDAQTPGEAIVLAWFLSDGSAVGAGEATLRLADGRVVRAWVEPVTGRLLLGTPRDGADRAAVADAPLEEDGPLARRRDPFEDLDTDDPQTETPGFREIGFRELGFRELGFRELGFEGRTFEDLGDRFERRTGSSGSRTRDPSGSVIEPDSEPGPSGPGVRTSPQPPQPR